MVRDGRGVIIGEPTFGKGTVQSLLDLDDYGLSDSARMGQLKITQAQFFRVNGGSTQNRGVEPDISFPTWGDPDEYGERALDNALPWTSIDPARYESVGELDQLAAVADSRYRDRMDGTQEFEWLLSDIADFNNVSYTNILVLDMLPEDNRRQKLLKGPDPWDLHYLQLESGYEIPVANVIEVTTPPETPAAVNP